MEANQPKINNSETNVSVPGKALLFGEYGVMRGGEAVAVCLPNFKMSVDFSFREDKVEPSYSLSSDYLSRTIVVERNKLGQLLESVEANEERNLACYLSGFSEFLQCVTLSANVSREFSPSLGFGSSSALLSAFHIALAERFFSPNLIEQLSYSEFWSPLYKSLMRLQGRGSGYDIALQTWAALNCKQEFAPTVLSFRDAAYGQATERAMFSPEISVVPMSAAEMAGMGCFVESGVRSETRRVLQNMEKKKIESAFYEQQTSFAKRFLAEPVLDNVTRLCREASNLALSYGLLPATDSLQSFTRRCDSLGIAWKTMGAGYGDCLWVIANRAQVESMISEISAPEMSVQFAFEDF